MSYQTVPLSTIKSGDWVTQQDMDKPVYVAAVNPETGTVTLFDYAKGDHLEELDPSVDDVLVDRIDDESVANAKKFDNRDRP